MLQFKQNDTSATIILTLTELVTIPNAYYLFVFTHVTTKDVVSFVLGQTDDQSAFEFRYNSFIINPSVLFAGYDPGEWRYRVYQQTSPTNINTSLTNGVIEYGRLILDRATDFAYSNYDTTTNYKEYNG
jgi:hypothetical protein